MRRDVQRSRTSGTTARLLVEDVADGIRVLATRDGVKVSEEQVIERARNIVAGLMGNYSIQSLDARDNAAQTPPRSRAARTVDQLDLLDQVEKRAERQHGRPVRA